MPFFHAFLEFLAVFNNSGLNHLPQQVVSFPGTLANSGENGESIVFLCDIIDQLLDQHGLTYSGTTEKSDLSSFQIRLQQVNNFDTSVKDLLGSRKILKLGRFPMNRQRMVLIQITETINRITDNIHDPSSDLPANRHRNRSSGSDRLHPSTQTISGIHRHTTCRLLTDMLLNLNY